MIFCVQNVGLFGGMSFISPAILPHVSVGDALNIYGIEGLLDLTSSTEGGMSIWLLTRSTSTTAVPFENTASEMIS